MKRIGGLAAGLALLGAPLGAPLDAHAAAQHHLRAVAPSSNDKLRWVMDPEMLAVDVPAFEKTAGPALRVWPDGRRDYQIDGCALTALTSGTTVTGLTLALGKACTVDLNRFFVFPFDFPTANAMSLGDFNSRIHGNDKATVDCLEACSDGAPTVVHEHFVGSDMLAHLQVTLDVTIDDEARRAALARWTTAMHDGGSDYLSAARYQCDARFDPVAFEAFGKIKPSAVTIGYNLPAPKC
jgi:hypothetical protein